MTSILFGVLLLGVSGMFIVRTYRRWEARQLVTDQIGVDTHQWLESDFPWLAPLPVVETRSNAHHDQLWFDLGGRGQLWMKCFWPLRLPLARLCAARFAESIGWEFIAETPSGERFRLHAWHVAYSPNPL